MFVLSAKMLFALFVPNANSERERFSNQPSISAESFDPNFDEFIEKTLFSSAFTKFSSSIWGWHKKFFEDKSLTI